MINEGVEMTPEVIDGVGNEMKNDDVDMAPEVIGRMEVQESDTEKSNWGTNR